jgi:CheY-like chemotaxis protein
MKKKIKIFLVDNDKDDQLIFMEALAEINNAILLGIAKDGVEAIEMLEKLGSHPDIIFMEIYLPKMNGIECLEKIEENPLINEIPVVIISACTEKLELARHRGARAFVKKPESINILQTKLEEIINLDFIVDRAIAIQTFQAA